MSSSRKSSDVPQLAGPTAKRGKTRCSTVSDDFHARILFADAGCSPSRLKQMLIKDERECLQTMELVETAALTDASIVIGADFPDDFWRLDVDWDFLGWNSWNATVSKKLLSGRT